MEVMHNFMELKTILELIREFGPSVIMFGFGLWGIYKTWIKVQDDEKRIKEREDKLIENMTLVLDRRETQKQKKHDELLKYRKEVIYKCNTFAKEIMEKTDADHVAIYDYCNGTQNLSGIPFVNFKIIAEKRNNPSIKSVFGKIEINTLGVFLLDLEKEQVISIKNINKEEDKYPELGHFMKLNKQHKGVYSNIVGVDSSLGFISITFSHNKKVDYKLVEKVIFTYTQKVSNLLDFVNLNS